MPFGVDGIGEAGDRIGVIMAELVINVGKETTNALNAAGFATKSDLLEALAARVPSMGFSRHEQPGGKQFFVRYSVAPNGGRRSSHPYVNVWLVPPGPYIVEGGAKAHDITTTWGRGNTTRTITHPGIPPRPFWDDAIDKAARREGPRMAFGLIDALRKAVA